MQDEIIIMGKQAEAVTQQLMQHMAMAPLTAVGAVPAAGRLTGP